MAIFYTDSGSLRDLKVSGSTLMSATTGLAVQVRSSGSTIFSISGSGGEIFNVSDIGSSTALFTISSGSNTIVNVDNTRNIIVSGSLMQGNINPSLSIGAYAHVEGSGSQASGIASHAEGRQASTTGNFSHAEGISCSSTGEGSHAEGASSTAMGPSSHAEGQATTAYGTGSHSEGNGTLASGSGAHAEGQSTTASGQYSHAEGSLTVALGNYSHASGRETIASGSYQTVTGQWNKQNNTTSLFVIGNGTSNINRQDILNVTTTSVQITGSTQITSNVALCVTDGSTSIGAASSDNSAKLQISSTTKGFLPPVMTTTQRTNISSPASGLIVYDTTLGQLCIYIVDAWKGISTVTI